MIASNFTVNDINHLSHISHTITLQNIDNKSKPKESIFKFIKPNVARTRRIFGKCLDFNDNLFRLLEDSKASAFYKAIKLSDSIQVNIKECDDDSHQEEGYPNGVFYGVLLWIKENEHNVKQLVPEIHCWIPSSQMDRLMTSITQTPSPQIQISVEVLSFRREIDKTLSEPWMSKDLLLEDNTPALLTAINVSSSIIASISKAEDIADKKTKNPLKIITMLLWIISALLLLLLFK